MKYLKLLLIALGYKLTWLFSPLVLYVGYDLRHRARYYYYNVRPILNKVSFRVKIRYYLYTYLLLIFMDDGCDHDIIDSSQCPTILKDMSYSMETTEKFQQEYLLHYTDRFQVTKDIPTSDLYKRVAIKYQQQINFTYRFMLVTNLKDIFYINNRFITIGYTSLNISHNGKVVYVPVFTIHLFKKKGE